MASNVTPVTWSGLFDWIRPLFALTPLARMRGYKPARFSYHLRDGRCQKCDGRGQLSVEMHFLSDVWTICDECQGKRYNTATLEVYYGGKNIADVLNMEISQAFDFFHAHQRMQRVLR